MSDTSLQCFIDLIQCATILYLILRPYYFSRGAEIRQGKE